MAILAQLGTSSQITIGTQDVQASWVLYQKIGFTKVAEDTTPNNWMQITDNSTLILLNEDGMAYMGITYFAPDMRERVATLEKAGINFVHKTDTLSNTDKTAMDTSAGFFQAIFASPDGFYVSLIQYDSGQTGKGDRITLAEVPESEWQNMPNPNAKIGIFGELCVPVKDLQTSIAFWESLGFTSQVFDKPYPWAIMNDGLNIVGLHQTADFATPAITYFAQDMGTRIKALQAEGVDSLEVFGGTGGNNDSNMILHTPEGQRFFLFSF
jgi:predicted lactoylglutathione lyase